MSYPHDSPGRPLNRHATTSALDEAVLQGDPYPPLTFEQQISMQNHGYDTPYLGKSDSHQTSAQVSSSYPSQRESLLFPRSGSHFPNTTTDTTQFSLPPGRDVPVDYGYIQQYPQGPYVAGATCSIDSHESHQNPLGREPRHSVRHTAPLPLQGRRSDNRGGPYESNDGYTSGNGTSRHRESSVLDDEDVPLEGHRGLQIPPDLPPTYKPTHRRRNTLAGLGGHLEDRPLDQSDTRTIDEGSLIYGNSNEDGHGYTDPGTLNLSPDSLTSSLASLAVNVGSASGSHDDYTGDQQPRRPSDGDARHSSTHWRRPSISRHEGDRLANVDPREQSQRNSSYLPAASRSQRPPCQGLRSEFMADPTTQTSFHYQISGQQMSPATVGFPPGFNNPSAATAGYHQLPRQGFALGNSHGDGYHSTGPDYATGQYPSENGVHGHLYWPPGDGRGNDIKLRPPRY